MSPDQVIYWSAIEGASLGLETKVCWACIKYHWNEISFSWTPYDQCVFVTHFLKVSTPRSMVSSWLCGGVVVILSPYPSRMHWPLHGLFVKSRSWKCGLITSDNACLWFYGSYTIRIASVLKGAQKHGSLTKLWLYGTLQGIFCEKLGRPRPREREREPWSLKLWATSLPQAINSIKAS